ncbi:hypothetical protein ACJX0J_004247 [Zea mays]
MDSYKDGILPNGIREFLLLSFFLSIEETGTIQFNIFWNLVYRWMNCIADIDPKKKNRGWDPPIVNFYTELENYIFVINPCLKRIIEGTLNPLLLGFKKRIKINKKKFHNKSLDSELGTHNLSFGFLVF